MITFTSLAVEIAIGISFVILVVLCIFIIVFCSYKEDKLNKLKLKKLTLEIDKLTGQVNYYKSKFKKKTNVIKH